MPGFVAAISAAIQSTPLPVSLDEERSMAKPETLRSKPFRNEAPTLGLALEV